MTETPGAKKVRWWDSALAYGIVRILLFVSVLIAFKVGCVALATHQLHTTVSGLFLKPLAVLVPAIVPIILGALALYWLGVRCLEQRTVSELALRSAVSYLPLGLGCGFLSFAFVLAAVSLQGHVTYGGYAGLADAPAAALIFTAGVIFEELIYRGAMFRIVEETLGTAAALAISAVLFGGSHLGNNGATLISAAALAVAGGVTWGLTYTLSKSLWLPIGMHLGWNFTQGALFGTAVSGFRVPSVFRIGVSGPEWVTGGAFGPEASVYTALMGIILVFVLGVVAQRQGKWVPIRFRESVNMRRGNMTA